MRRALVGTTLTAIALLVIAEPANAAPRAGSAASAATSSVTTSTDKFVEADWSTDPISTAAGFQTTGSGVVLDISWATGSPRVTRVFVGFCVDYYDASMNFTKETCTRGDISSGFAYTFDGAHLTHASVRASGIPAYTCSVDANFEPIGQCKPAAPISVKATWTGRGPITYSTFTSYTPGVNRIVTRDRSREADVSATLNGKAPRGQIGHNIFYASTTTETIFN